MWLNLNSLLAGRVFLVVRHGYKGARIVPK